MGSIIKNTRKIFTDGGSSSSGGGITSVVGGTNITIDNTDPLNPIINGIPASAIIVVANYSALPAVGTVSGKFYWCSAKQGTSWLPGSFGGTFYNSGLYYSNGISWEFLNVPYNATQTEVNTGTNDDKFVTPNTLTNATVITNKELLVNKVTNFSTVNDTLYPTTKAVVGLVSGLSALFFYKTLSVVVGTYYTMTSTASVGALQTIVNVGVVTGQKLATFITNTGSPNITFLPSGVVRVNIHADKSVGTKNTQLYAVISKRILAGTETVLCTTGYSILLPTGGASSDYMVDGSIPNGIILLSTDLILVDIYAYCPLGGSAPTITLGVEDNTAARLELPISNIDLSNYITANSTNTLTNKRITKRIGTVVSSATPTINTDNIDYYSITALATNITSMTTNLSGTPTEDQPLRISITDNGTARLITWGASFEGALLPTTTIISTELELGFVWNTSTNKWKCLANSDATSSGGGTWGSITGILSAQTDLQTALNLKADKTITITAKVANHTLVLTDAWKHIPMNLAVANTVTIPLNATVALPLDVEILISQYGIGQTQILKAVGVTINSIGNADKIVAKGGAVSLKQIAIDEWDMWGALEQTSSSVINTSEIDFGTTPISSKRFTITDALISTTSRIMVTPNGEVATGRVGNDWEWDSINFSAVAGTGQFILTAKASGKIKGKRKIYYTNT